MIVERHRLSCCLVFLAGTYQYQVCRASSHLLHALNNTDACGSYDACWHLPPSLAGILSGDA